MMEISTKGEMGVAGLTKRAVAVSFLLHEIN